MGGGSVLKRAIDVIKKAQGTSTGASTSTGTGATSISLGMGQSGQEEEKAKKDKEKSNTLSKKKLGTRGVAIPLQSTQTISGDFAAKGVQI